VLVSRIGGRLNGPRPQFLDKGLLRGTPLEMVLIFSGEHLKKSTFVS